MPITGFGAGKRSASDRNRGRSLSCFHSGIWFRSGLDVILNPLQFRGCAQDAPARAIALRPTLLQVVACAETPLCPARRANFLRPQLSTPPELLRRSPRAHPRRRTIRAAALAETRQEKRLLHPSNRRSVPRTRELPRGCHPQRSCSPASPISAPPREHLPCEDAKMLRAVCAFQ